MSIFQYGDYRPYIHARIKKQPRGGRGEFLKMAKALEMHTSSISQVFAGRKRLTPEQGCRLAAHLGLSDLESDYLLNLIEKERAGTEDLRNRVEKRLRKIRELAEQMVHRVPRDQIISEEDRYVFYSNWFYSAIRLATDIRDSQSIEGLSARFNLAPALVNEVMGFLVQRGLCVEKEGLYQMGPQRTHLEASSPLASRLHSNWRMKAIERSPKLDQTEEFQFSSPMVLSHSDAQKIRAILMEQAKDVLKIAAPSDSETLYCLNIDWIQVK